MDNMQLVAEKRAASGKGAARELRRSGRIPAILYGEGDPQPLSVDAKNWVLKYRHVSGNTIISLTLGKEKHQVLVKDTQSDIITGRVRHIDFYAVHADQKLTAMVPVHLEGTPHGIREGGILEHKIEELEVQCLPGNLPDFFTVDISHLGVGESLHVGEIPTIEGVEIKTDPGLTLVIVGHAKASTEAVPVAETEVVVETPGATL